MKINANIPQPPGPTIWSRIIFIALTLLIIRIPFEHTFALESIALVGCLLGLIGLWWSGRKANQFWLAPVGENWFNWVEVPLFLLFGQLFFASLFAVQPGLHLDEWRAGSLKFLIVYLAASRGLQRRKDFRILIYLLAGVSLYSGLAGLVETGYRISGSFPHPNVLAKFMIIAIPFLFWEFAESRSLPGRLFLGSTMVISLINFVRAGSRGGWTAFILMAFFYVIMQKGKTWKVVLVGMVILTATAALTDSARERIGHLFEAATYQEYGLSNRYEIWQVGLKMIPERPAMGYGAGTQSFRNRYRRELPEAYIRPPHVHNNFLLYAIEGGIVGAILFAWLSLRLITCRRLANQNDHSEIHLLTIIAAVTTALTLFGLLEATFYFEENGILFFMLVGLAAGKPGGIKRKGA